MRGLSLYPAEGGGRWGVPLLLFPFFHFHPHATRAASLIGRSVNRREESDPSFSGEIALAGWRWLRLAQASRCPLRALARIGSDNDTATAFRAAFGRLVTLSSISLSLTGEDGGGK